MKLLISLSILLLFFLTAGSYIKLVNTSNQLEDSKTQNIILDKTVANYLHSLLNQSIDHSNSTYFLITGDTIRNTNIRKPSLFYLFSPEDCASCVEENILNLVELSKKNDSISIYIISSKEKLHYLSLMARSYTSNTLHLGYILGDEKIFISHYCIMEDGPTSNSYYPLKGYFESTKRYLESAINVISLE
jgi:hypothetical protein